MKFACFGGAAAVADEAVVAARHRSPRRRGKFFFGSNKGDKQASSPGTKRIVTSPGRHETDFRIYDMIAAGSGKSWPAPSSSALSTAASLDSAYSSSSSSCSSSRSSSSSSSYLEVAPTPAKRVTSPGEKRRSPATGAAAVLVCLLMMMFCGRLGATLLTTAVLCFFPRTWPPSRAKAPENLLSASSSPEHHAAPRRQAETMRTNAVTDGFLARNRKK